MTYRITQIPMTLSEFEGHFCCYEWQNASRSLCNIRASCKDGYNQRRLSCGWYLVFIR